MRKAHLAAVTAALTLGITGTASAALHAAYDFNETMGSSYGGTVNAPDLLGLDTATNAFGADQGYSYPATGLPLTSASFVLVVDFDQADPQPGITGTYQRIIGPAGSDQGLYLKDGVPVWRSGSGVESTETPTALSDNREQLTVTSFGTDINVYRGSGSSPIITEVDTLSGSGGVQLFKDNAAEDEANGTLERFRAFTNELSGDEVAALYVLDTTEPTEIDFSDYSEGTYFDGSETWVGRWAGFNGTSNDDGTAPLIVDASLLNAAGDQTIFGSPTFSNSYAELPAGNEELVSQVGFAFDMASLTDGAQYRVRSGVTDMVGNGISQDRLVRLDKTAPGGFSLDLPAETDDRTPELKGAATVGARDSDTIYGTVCKGETCDWESEDPGEYVGSFEAKISGGRWSTSTLTKWVYDRGFVGGHEMTVGDLPLGAYVVSASHADMVSNFAEVEKVVKVVEGKPAPGPAPVVPPVVNNPGPAQLSPAALLTRNRQSIIASLLKEGLAGLTKDGKGIVDVFVDRPATVIVQIFDGSAPRKIDPRAKAAAKKRKKAKKVVKPIAVGSKRLAAAGAAKVTVKLSKRGKALLRRKRSRKLIVRTIIVPNGAGAIADTQKVTVKR